MIFENVLRVYGMSETIQITIILLVALRAIAIWCIVWSQSAADRDKFFIMMSDTIFRMKVVSVHASWRVQFFSSLIRIWSPTLSSKRADDGGSERPARVELESRQLARVSPHPWTKSSTANTTSIAEETNGKINSAWGFLLKDARQADAKLTDLGDTDFM